MLKHLSRTKLLTLPDPLTEFIYNEFKNYKKLIVFAKR